MAEESGGEPRREAGCGIGARLRDARERAGLSIAQAALRLHVSGETLEALEAERFDALGAPIYVKSYLGRYAELLGEPAAQLQEQLASNAAIPAPDLTRVPHVTAEQDRYGALAAGVIMAVLVLAVAALVWWGWSRIHRGQAVAAFVPHTAPQRPLVYGAQPAERVPSAAVAAAVPRTAGAVPESAPVAAAATAGGSARLTLSFPAASWVGVTDAAGHHLYRGMVPGGVSKTFTGPAPLHVVLGYADGVTLTVNGHAASFAPYVGRDHVVSIAVAADGRISPAPRHAGG